MGYYCPVMMGYYGIIELTYTLYGWPCANSRRYVTYLDGVGSVVEFVYPVTAGGSVKFLPAV